MDFKERYSRHLLLPGFGEEAQQKLANASVLLIGAGGLGSPISLYLTAAGIGHLGLVDDDVVSISNLQRQILYKEDKVGESKVLCAKEALLTLNSTTKIDTYPVRFSEENAIQLISQYDMVVDGTDNFESRYLINDVCVGLNKTYVYGAVGEYTGQVSVFNYKNGATYRCLYNQPNITPEKKVLGIIGVLPGIIGSIEALEVIKVITNCGEVLSNKLFYIDGQIMQTKILKIIPNKEQTEIAKRRFLQLKDSYKK